MSLIDVIKVQVSRQDPNAVGVITKQVYRRFDTALQDWLWVVDIDLDIAPDNPNSGQSGLLVGVPINDPAREVFRADVGSQVSLERRQGDGRYVVTGLSIYKPGTLSVCLVDISPCGTVINSIGTPVNFGNVFRLLTYTELGDTAVNFGFAYGQLPYGQTGKFDLNGNLLTLT